jgi:CBS domain-containing protein
LSPLSVAIGSEATFVARSVDVDIKHLTMVLERAAKHEGTAFVEIYQDCNVFNSGAFYYASKKGQKEDNIIYLEHGKPLIFGKNRDKGIRVNEGNRPEVVEIGKGVSEDDLLFHDEKMQEPSLAFMLARMRYPEFPEPMGIFRQVQRPIYDQGVQAQVDHAIETQGKGDLNALFTSGDTWVVSPEGAEPRYESSQKEAGFDLLSNYEPRDSKLERKISDQSVDVLKPKKPVTIETTASVREAISTLVGNKIGCLLVSDNGQLAGVFTERDLLNKGSSDADGLDRSVSELMTPSPVTIKIEDSIAYALHLMDLGGYRHLPIVGDDGVATGIISVRDIQRYLCAQFAE